jgi:hypothetical protein
MPGDENARPSELTLPLMKPLLNGLPAPTGWSETMRRWLASTQPLESAMRLVVSAHDGDQTVRVALEEIRAVRVDDMAQVLAHRIARIMGSTSHVVQFIGGGELRYVHDNQGQVIELSSAGVRVSISPQRVLSFGVPDRGRGSR